MYESREVAFLCRFGYDFRHCLTDSFNLGCSHPLNCECKGMYPYQVAVSRGHVNYGVYTGSPPSDVHPDIVPREVMSRELGVGLVTLGVVYLEVQFHMLLREVSCNLSQSCLDPSTF